MSSYPRHVHPHPVLAFALGITACTSPSGIRCGAGTELDSGACVATGEDVSCGEGTILVGDTCMPETDTAGSEDLTGWWSINFAGGISTTVQVDGSLYQDSESAYLDGSVLLEGALSTAEYHVEHVKILLTSGNVANTWSGSENPGPGPCTEYMAIGEDAPCVGIGYFQSAYTGTCPIHYEGIGLYMSGTFDGLAGGGGWYLDSEECDPAKTGTWTATKSS